MSLNFRSRAGSGSARAHGCPSHTIPAISLAGRTVSTAPHTERGHTGPASCSTASRDMGSWQTPLPTRLSPAPPLQISPGQAGGTSQELGPAPPLVQPLATVGSILPWVLLHRLRAQLGTRCHPHSGFRLHTVLLPTMFFFILKFCLGAGITPLLATLVSHECWLQPWALPRTQLPADLGRRQRMAQGPLLTWEPEVHLDLMCGGQGWLPCPPTLHGPLPQPPASSAGGWPWGDLLPTGG